MFALCYFARENLINPNRYGWFHDHSAVGYDGALLLLLDQFRCTRPNKHALFVVEILLLLIHSRGQAVT
jgi:hypothetical protein